MRTVVVEPPRPVIHLEEAKQQLRVDSDEEDALIAGIVAAATGTIDGPDGWLGRAIGVQTLEVYRPAPALIGLTVLPFRPIIEVEGVDARMSGGGWAAIAPTAYELRGDRLYFRADAAPAGGWSIGDPEGMRVRYRAGYEFPPAPIRQAILVMIESMYRNRGSSEFTMPNAVAVLLQPFRVFA